MAANLKCVVYGVVGNIPPDYHSCDLRNYFSQFIETGGFVCFHFRHRPEARSGEVAREAGDAGPEADGGRKDPPRTRSMCCVIQQREDKLGELVRLYHRKHWIDRKGDSVPELCIISKVRATASKSKSSQCCQYKTRKEQNQIPLDREDFTQEDLLELPELHPPDIMPNGNVGTPTRVFLDFIKQCRLPPLVIKKLGLIFPKMRSNRKYGNVPLDYGTEVHAGAEEEEPEVKSASGKRLLHEDSSLVMKSAKSSAARTKSRAKAEDTKKVRQMKRDSETKRLMNLRIEENMIEKEMGSDSGEDNDTCEEWERHEALHDDPANQERNAERLFEEEIELKWEKGGSGLVFYTDAQVWKQQEGDFDEQTADDWDLDMAVYYDEGAGDMDARDHVLMRQEKHRRQGRESTSMWTIGKFEKYTKGFGRKILERQGWRDGLGLGSSVAGMKEALENKGQHPRNKAGFGYHRKKIFRYGGPLPRQQQRRKVLISTIYDDPAETDPPSPLLRRNEPYHLKHRLFSSDEET